MMARPYSEYIITYVPCMYCLFSLGLSDSSNHLVEVVVVVHVFVVVVPGI